MIRSVACRWMAFAQPGRKYLAGDLWRRQAEECRPTLRVDAHPTIYQ